MIFESYTGETKIGLTGLLAVFIVTIINYFAQVPFRFILSLIGIVLCVFAAKKLYEEFSVPLVFIRGNGINYWSGAFGVLIGTAAGLYGALRDISLPDFLAELSLIAIYFSLATILFMGAILYEVREGYLTTE